MNDKTRRQGAILRLVRERRISTQEELVSALGAAGYDVVQTTVSRDVHEPADEGADARREPGVRARGRP